MSRTVKSELQGTSPFLADGVKIQIFYPISEILKDEEGVYQRIFTFLLQLCRTKDLLDRVSMVMVQCEKGDGERDAHIVHVVRGELLWFVNTVIHHIGVVVCLVAEITG